MRRFPGLVWLEPEPAEPFAALTAAVAARWPDHPPYGGVFDTVIPHLTVVESEDAPLDAVEEAARRARPSRAEPSASRLWCQNAAGPLADPLAHAARGQTVMSSRCSPQVTRSRSLISPTVA